MTVSRQSENLNELNYKLALFCSSTHAHTISALFSRYLQINLEPRKLGIIVYSRYFTPGTLLPVLKDLSTVYRGVVI